MSAAKILKETFFSNDILNIKPISGCLCENYKYYIGGIAGPSKNISNLIHELCHFAELPLDRLKQFKSDWGLRYGKFWQIGTRWGYEPQTTQSVIREARVWAFQLSAQKHLNIGDNAEELVSSAIFLPAWCLYSYQFKTRGFRSSDKKGLYKLANMVERMAKNYTWDRLVEDSHFRINQLGA